MRELGRVTYHYYDRKGFSLDLEIIAFERTYCAAVKLNGCLARRAHRPTLSSSLRWGVSRADCLLELFGFAPVQLSFDVLLREVKQRLAA